MGSSEIFVVVMLTAVVMVLAAIGIGWLIAPKSTNAYI